MVIARRLLPAAIAACVFCAPVSAAPVTVRVQSGLIEPDGTSESPMISADGTVVAFLSNATNLTPGMHPDSTKLFAYDRIAGTISQLTPDATNGYIDNPSVSRDGRYFAFDTNSTNLPANGPDGESVDVLRYDRVANTFLRASLGVGGAKANAASAYPAISGDGRYIAFLSYASNLVAAPATTQFRAHIFVMDTADGSIQLASRAANENLQADDDSQALEPSAMSHDGRRLVFTTEANNIAPVSLGNNFDVIVRTVNAQGVASFQNVNRGVNGELGEGSSDRGSISPNGRYVVFRSSATNIIGGQPNPSSLLWRDLQDNVLRGMPLPAGYQTCNRARVGDDGTVLMQCQQEAQIAVQQVFLVPNGGAPRLTSFARDDGAPGNADSGNTLSMSANASLVAFESAATDLIDFDGNEAVDVYLVGEPAAFNRLFRDGFE